jgi:hypothetical protein
VEAFAGPHAQTGECHCDTPGVPVRHARDPDYAPERVQRLIRIRQLQVDHQTRPHWKGLRGDQPDAPLASVLDTDPEGSVKQRAGDWCHGQRALEAQPGKLASLHWIGVCHGIHLAEKR